MTARPRTRPTSPPPSQRRSRRQSGYKEEKDRQDLEADGPRQPKARAEGPAADQCGRRRALKRQPQDVDLAQRQAVAESRRAHQDGEEPQLSPAPGAAGARLPRRRQRLVLQRARQHVDARRQQDDARRVPQRHLDSESVRRTGGGLRRVGERYEEHGQEGGDSCTATPSRPGWSRRLPRPGPPRRRGGTPPGPSSAFGERPRGSPR